MATNKSFKTEPRHPDIMMLVCNLADRDFEIREKSRQELVASGKSAIPALAEVLKTEKRDLVRWEAAKALYEMRLPETGPVLVASLEDEDFDVRWASAEGLINVGFAALKPILNALKEKPDSVNLRQGAHHILSHLAGMDKKADHHIYSHPRAAEASYQASLKPVIMALGDIEANAMLPSAVKRAYEDIFGRE
jgi:HEAT repeat protein